MEQLSLLEFGQKSKRRTSAIVKILKNTNQDFEWYPTTIPMLADIRKHMGFKYTIKSYNSKTEKDENIISIDSILDCGAGDGRALDYLAGSGRKFAIEKSEKLITELSSDVYIVGTDFHKSTLIDKEVHVLFSNPPYREFENWAIKIISEANARDIYLILPERWQRSQGISEALKSRNVEAKIINHHDFLDGERAARANVNIIHIDMTNKNKCYSTDNELAVDPFESWFDKTFIFQAELSKDELQEEKAKNKEEKKSLIQSKGLIAALVVLYNKEMGNLQKNFLRVTDLDPVVMREIGVSVKGIREALKQRIKGLKNKYWNEFFNNYSPLTDRLTTASREAMRNKLSKNMSIDFTESNALAVTIWAIKNANKYYNTQLINLVEGMIDKANIILYKSNQRTFGDEDWRYCRKPKNLSKFALELRIILTGWEGIEGGGHGYSFDYINGLHKNVHDYINDILTVAKNLNFDAAPFEDSRNREWVSNKKQDFHYYDKAGKMKILFTIRAFKNGNKHIKFNQDFIRSLNVEFGRLKGWIKNAKQASEEMNIPLKTAITFFEANYQLEQSKLPMLTLNIN
jgi:predicted DNA-binding protein YlxM (UPF0122 family)